MAACPATCPSSACKTGSVQGSCNKAIENSKPLGHQWPDTSTLHHCYNVIEDIPCRFLRNRHRLMSQMLQPGAHGACLSLAQGHVDDNTPEQGEKLVCNSCLQMSRSVLHHDTYIMPYHNHDHLDNKTMPSCSKSGRYSHLTLLVKREQEPAAHTCSSSDACVVVLASFSRGVQF